MKIMFLEMKVQGLKNPYPKYQKITPTIGKGQPNS